MVLWGGIWPGPAYVIGISPAQLASRNWGQLTWGRDAWPQGQVPRPHFLLSLPCQKLVGGFLTTDRKIQLLCKALAWANVHEQHKQQFCLHCPFLQARQHLLGTYCVRSPELVSMGKMLRGWLRCGTRHSSAHPFSSGQQRGKKEAQILVSCHGMCFLKSVGGCAV